MDCLQNIKDSVETSLTLKLFTSKKTSSYYHIFNSEFLMFPISMCEELNNFNPDRLSNNPYPETSAIGLGGWARQEQRRHPSQR